MLGYIQNVREPRVFFYSVLKLEEEHMVNTVSVSNAIEQADAVYKEKKLPHFFKSELRLVALEERKNSPEVRKEILEIFSNLFHQAATIAQEKKFNVVDIHKFSAMSTETQANHFPGLNELETNTIKQLENTGHMPNKVMAYALKYAAYKEHLHDKNRIKSEKKIKT